MWMWLVFCCIGLVSLVLLGVLLVVLETECLAERERYRRPVGERKAGDRRPRAYTSHGVDVPESTPGRPRIALFDVPGCGGRIW